jgi:hypothetical protein
VAEKTIGYGQGSLELSFPSHASLRAANVAATVGNLQTIKKFQLYANGGIHPSIKEYSVKMEH